MAGVTTDKQAQISRTMRDVSELIETARGLQFYVDTTEPTLRRSKEQLAEAYTKLYDARDTLRDLLEAL